MVQMGDFKVEIVEAESKIRFKEHYKHGRVYVEVEPEAEYFISIAKIGRSVSHPTMLKIVVDGQELNYYVSFRPRQLKLTPSYRGLRSCVGGVRTYSALKFVKPYRRATMSKNDPLATIANTGTIQVVLYKATFRGEREIRNTQRNSIVVASGATTTNGKKVLRSGEGGESFHKPVQSRYKSYQQGALMGSIDFHYCAAAGLVEAGVLAKPVFEPLVVPRRNRKRNRLEVLRSAPVVIDLCDDEIKEEPVNLGPIVKHEIVDCVKEEDESAGDEFLLKEE